MDPLSPAINPSWSTSPRPHVPPALSPSSSTYIRDPQIYGDPGTGLVSPPPDSAGTQGSGKLPPFLRVRIGGLERNRKDLLLRYDASCIMKFQALDEQDHRRRQLALQSANRQTNLPNFRTSLYRNMQRSYAEFQKFAEQIQLCCPQNDRLVRIALQRWFTRVCEDPALQQEDELRSFIESDFGYQPVPPPSARRPASSTTAVPQVLSAALSKVVRRGPSDEDDDLQLAKGALEKLEERWGGAATTIGALGKARRALATANTDVGAKLMSLATVEQDANLATAERKIGRVYEQLANLAASQAASENVVISDSLGYQALNARAAKDTLIQRTQVLEDAQNASKAAITKRRNVERLKASSSISAAKVDDAIEEMKDADQLDDQLTKRIRAMSANLHTSLRTHSSNAHEDIAVSLLEHARMSIIYHRQTLRELEALKPDIARIGGPVPAAATPVSAATPSRYAAVSSSAAASPAGIPTASPVAPPTSAPSHAPPPQAQPAMTPSQPYRPTPTAPPMQTSQSMFLPPPSTPGVPRPHSADPLHGAGGPLGPPMTPAQPGGMAQSMMLPGQRAQTVGRAQAKRLDERKAAKMLAGGF